VGIVYDQETLVYYGNDDAMSRYVDDVRGFEQALNKAHIPYDIISTSMVDGNALASYKVLILPTLANMTDRTAQALRRFVADGGGLIASYETGFYNRESDHRAESALADALGITGAGRTARITGEPTGGPVQGYMRLRPGHPLTAGLDEVGLILMAGRYCNVAAAGDGAVPLTLASPFRLFPEGLSYPEEPDPGCPMAVAREHAGGGRTVYFAPQIGKCAFNSRFPDLFRLITNATTWCLGGEDLMRVDAPASLHTSLRRSDKRLMVHCVNLTGGERFFTEIVPLHNCGIAVRIPDGWAGVAASVTSSGEDLAVSTENGFARVTVPRLGDYDIVVFEECR
jgi:hypothetical protein